MHTIYFCFTTHFGQISINYQCSRQFWIFLISSWSSLEPGVILVRSVRIHKSSPHRSLLQADTPAHQISSPRCIPCWDTGAILWGTDCLLYTCLPATATCSPLFLFVFKLKSNEKGKEGEKRHYWDKLNASAKKCHHDKLITINNNWSIWLGCRRMDFRP